MMPTDPFGWVLFAVVAILVIVFLANRRRQ